MVVLGSCCVAKLAHAAARSVCARRAAVRMADTTKVTSDMTRTAAFMCVLREREAEWRSPTTSNGHTSEFARAGAYPRMLPFRGLYYRFRRTRRRVGVLARHDRVNPCGRVILLRLSSSD